MIYCLRRILDFHSIRQENKRQKEKMKNYATRLSVIDKAFSYSLDIHTAILTHTLSFEHHFLKLSVPAITNLQLPRTPFIDIDILFAE